MKIIDCLLGMRFAYTMIIMCSRCSWVLSQSTGYTYDALGNRTAVSNQISLTSATAFSFEPRRVLAGDRVNIYGQNFPAGNNAAVLVGFNGVQATVISVSTRVITV